MQTNKQNSHIKKYLLSSVINWHNFIHTGGSAKWQPQIKDLWKLLVNNQHKCWNNKCQRVSYVHVLVCELDPWGNNMSIVMPFPYELKAGGIQAGTRGLLFFCLRAFLFRVFLFQEPQTFILLPLYSAAQFFPGLRRELLTLLASYSKNCCQVWIKCFTWRFELLLTSHKGNFYGIRLVGTNIILFNLDSLSAL